MLVNKNRMVVTIQNFEPFGKKWLTIFDTILEDFAVTETII